MVVQIVPSLTKLLPKYMQKIFFSEQSSKWKQSKWRQKQEEISTTFKFPFYFTRNKKQLVADSENLHQLQYLPNYQVKNEELGQSSGQN